MDRKYWEEVAVKHEEKIFDVFGNDSSQVIVSCINHYASPAKTVVDIGCAVGRWLPLLSAGFKKVYAVDISALYIQKAKENHKALKNIQYLRQDISKSKEGIPACDLALCINTMLTPDRKERDAAFKNTAKVIKRKGHLILVVPALESAMFSQFIFNHWNTRTGNFDPVKSEKIGDATDIFEGVVKLDTTPTKHHSKEELQFILNHYGFEMEHITKVEYSWNTEFSEPPEWLKNPRPFDWLVVARKR
jgi:SAM-dependent methyltransferase